MIPDNPRNGDGFTLIELMITLVIIGILSAIAYPAYTKYTMESRRSDAYSSMSSLANNLEKFYSQCGNYTMDITTTGGLNCTTPTPNGTLGLGANGAQSLNGYYTLAITTATANGAPPAGYLITATAQGIQAKDTDCQTITLDSTGAKHAKNSSSADTSSICWKQ